MKNIKIIGSGISAATLANKLANNGWSVDVYEKNPYVGGNCYDFINNDGILVHKFGPHIFHTSDDEVYSFIKNFDSLNSYINKVKASWNGLLFPLPINFDSINIISKNNSEISKQTIDLLKEEFSSRKTITIFELLNSKNEHIEQLGRWLFENVYENYTSKMWGINISDINPSIINRVKIILSNNHNYFPNDKYQGLPINGYSGLIKKMLNHSNIHLHLSVNGLDHLTFGEEVLWDKKKTDDTIVYCGSLDEALNYQYGMLPYRSLNIKFETHNVSQYQDVAVINYPADPTMTRVVEYKQMTFQKVNSKTTISKEYPGQFDPESKMFGIRFYPIINPKNLQLYDKYLSYFKKYKNFYPLGRLAQYKYFDMDDAIKQALELSKEILHA